MLIYFKSTRSYLFKKPNPGFTLVELLVVISIATVILTALVIQQRKWDDQLALNAQTYELALMLRQAQIYSLGVRENSGSVGDKFNIGYGVNFNDDNMNQYIYYADKDRDQVYDLGEGIETKTFTRGVAIHRFCGLNIGATQERCSDQFGNVDNIDITFFRPDPKANVGIYNGGQNQTGSVNPPAIIYLRSAQGKESSVKIETNGQISIQ
jgi:prepilin-type N-terminal cleavage/methylation domain-containing protein